MHDPTFERQLAVEIEKLEREVKRQKSMFEDLSHENDELMQAIKAYKKELKEYNDLAAEYGIDGKTMLALAKSQIATAKSNCELREELDRYQDAEKEGRLLDLPCSVGDEVYDVAAAEAALREFEKNED